MINGAKKKALIALVNRLVAVVDNVCINVQWAPTVGYETRIDGYVLQDAIREGQRR